MPFPKGGVGRAWARSYANLGPLDAVERAEALIFSERCGCLGDVAYHDRVAPLIPGAVYRCPKRSCRATWVVGVP